MMIPVVVKVGGSLYDDPRLGPGLRKFFEAIPEPVRIVAGGGPFADAVRDLDAWQKLGEEAAHGLALMACEVSSEFLRRLLGSPRSFVAHGPYLAIYERTHGPVPHTWELTTDSLAALAAKAEGARLVLLKSVDIPPGTSWTEAAARGWVDGYFPTAVADATFPIEAINFRSWLNEHFPPAAVG